MRMLIKKGVNIMYAMYLRKSRSDMEAESLGEMETLSKHKKILTDLAARNGHRIMEIYQEVVSGETIADRPEAQRLIKDVNKKIWKGIYVMEVERLARGDTKDQGIVSESFKYSKTLIITPTKTFDPDNAFDEEYFEFGLFMSRREYKTIQRRLHAGMMQSIKDGNYMGSVPPYGYDIDMKRRNDRTLKPNENAENVRMMFDWFVNEGLTCGEIARRLGKRGVLTKTGRKEWHRSTVQDILKNVLYTGKMQWYKRRISKEFDGEKLVRTKKRVNREDQMIIDGRHPAIIDQETFDKAQALFTGQVPVQIDKRIVNPLARLIFCKRCGKAMVMHNKNRGNTAVRYMHQTSTECKMKSTAADAVIDAVISALQNSIADFEYKLNHDNDKTIRDTKEKVIADLEKELKTLEDQRAGLFDKLERGIYTENEFLERKQTLTGRIDALQEEIYLERKSVPDEVDYHEQIYTFRRTIETLRNPNIDARHKNELLKAIIERIDYDIEDLGHRRGGKVKLDVYFL